MCTPSCLMDLENNFRLNLKEVASLQVCICIALDQPSHLDRGMEGVEISLPDVVSAVEKERKAAVDDLLMFHLKPPGVKGKNLFDRMIGRRHIKYADSKLIKKHNISDDFNSISTLKGRSQHHKDFVGINYAHKSESQIMMDVGDGSNLKVTSKAKNDNFWHVRSHSQFVNDPSCLKLMKKIYIIVPLPGIVE